MTATPEEDVVPLERPKSEVAECPIDQHMTWRSQGYYPFCSKACREQHFASLGAGDASGLAFTIFPPEWNREELADRTLRPWSDRSTP